MKHISSLDGIRGIAILMVLLVHLQTFGAVPGSSGVAQRVKGLISLGWTGVDLFFVLSGFLITGILLNSKERGGYFRNFYARRVLRIFPLYYLAILGSIAAWPIIVHLPKLAKIYPTAHGWVSYMLYFPNWWLPAVTDVRPVFLSHFWSLGVEEQFYFVWPFCVWFLNRRQLAVLCGIAMPVAMALRFLLLANHGESAGTVVFMNTFTRMDALLCGAACSLLIGHKTWLLKARRMLPYIAMVSAAGIIRICYLNGDIRNSGPYTQTVGYSLLAVGFGCAVLWACLQNGTGQWYNRILNIPALRSLGKYAYGLYVWHGFVYLLGWFLFHRQSWYGVSILPSIGFCIAMVGSSVAVALVSYHAFEARFLALKVRFDPDN